MPTPFTKRNDVIHRKVIEHLAAVRTMMVVGFLDFTPLLRREVPHGYAFSLCADALAVLVDFLWVLFFILGVTSCSFFFEVLGGFVLSPFFLPLFLYLFLMFCCLGDANVHTGLRAKLAKPSINTRLVHRKRSVTYKAVARYLSSLSLILAGIRAIGASSVSESFIGGKETVLTDGAYHVDIHNRYLLIR